MHKFIYQHFKGIFINTQEPFTDYDHSTGFSHYTVLKWIFGMVIVLMSLGYTFLK